MGEQSLIPAHTDTPIPAHWKATLLGSSCEGGETGQLSSHSRRALVFPGSGLHIRGADERSMLQAILGSSFVLSSLRQPWEQRSDPRLRAVHSDQA